MGLKLKAAKRQGSVYWYRKLWHPWGVTIGYHDFAFIDIGDETREITKHNKDGKFLFFCFVRKMIDHTETGIFGISSPFCFRSRSWKKFMIALEEDERQWQSRSHRSQSTTS